MILAGAQHEKALNSTIFPSIQGGPLMHVIAAKAVAFQEALQPAFKPYQQQVMDNARIMAETLVQRGVRVVSGRTESHMFLVDLRAKKITGKDAEAALGRGAHHGEQERDSQRSARSPSSRAASASARPP